MRTRTRTVSFAGRGRDDLHMGMHADVRPSPARAVALAAVLGLALGLSTARPAEARADDSAGGTEVTVSLGNQVVEEVDVSDGGDTDLAQTGSGEIVAAAALVVAGCAGCLYLRLSDHPREDDGEQDDGD